MLQVASLNPSLVQDHPSSLTQIPGFSLQRKYLPGWRYTQDIKTGLKHIRCQGEISRHLKENLLIICTTRTSATEFITSSKFIYPLSPTLTHFLDSCCVLKFLCGNCETFSPGLPFSLICSMWGTNEQENPVIRRERISPLAELTGFLGSPLGWNHKLTKEPSSTSKNNPRLTSINQKLHLV